MFERFTKDGAAVVDDAVDDRARPGRDHVEAEHLLLAVDRAATTPAARVLRDAGLDYDGLRAALAAETERSLAAVGVSADALHFSPFVETPAARPPRPSSRSSARCGSRSRAATSASAPSHIVLGASCAPAGTVAARARVRGRGPRRAALQSAR